MTLQYLNIYHADFQMQAAELAQNLPIRNSENQQFYAGLINRMEGTKHNLVAYSQSEPACEKSLRHRANYC